MKAYLSLCLLAAVAVLGVFAQPNAGNRRRGPGGRFRPRLDLANSDAVFYGYNRTVDNTNVFQRAISSQSDNKVIVGSMGRNLRSLGLSRGGSLLDFSGATPMRVIRTFLRCYVLPARDADTATFDATVTELQTRNGTTVTTALPEDQVLAAASALSETDRANFVEANPTVGAFCQLADIYETTNPTVANPFPEAGTEPEGQSVTSFLTFDRKVSILAPTPSRRFPGFFPRRGGGQRRFRLGNQG